MFDYLVVGAGFAGSTIAERLASHAGKSVLICDKRPHIAGNAYDHHDEAGVLVHKYGPHIFHTNSREVYEYLSRFTAWRPYQHRVRACVDGQLLPIPINLDTVNGLYGTRFTSFELENFFASVEETLRKLVERAVDVPEAEEFGAIEYEFRDAGLDLANEVRQAAVASRKKRGT